MKCKSCCSLATDVFSTAVPVLVHKPHVMWVLLEKACQHMEGSILLSFPLSPATTHLLNYYAIVWQKRIGKGNGCFMQTCPLHHSVTNAWEHTSWVGRPSKQGWLLCAVLAEHLQPCAACQKALEPRTELFLISRPHAHLACAIGVWLPMAGLMLAGLLW